MPAARDYDWTHVHVIGSHADAAPYLSFARKLLGYVKEDAARNGLMTNLVTKRLPDGALVAAEIRGNIPRITIAPPSRLGREVTTNLVPKFVVTPRNETWPYGLDAMYGQELLAPAWTPFAYTLAIAGRTSITDMKTYKRQFPDGVRYSASQDWCSPEGVRLYWYGPSRRYWWDNYRKTRGQYAPFVFLNGNILLNIEDHFAEHPIDEVFVLGAAYRDGWLYVMQAWIDELPTTYTIPTQPGWATGKSGWFSEPYPNGDNKLALYRYRVLKNPNPSGNADMFTTGSHELLWSHTGRGWVNPWFFDPQVTVCESFAMPDELRFICWDTSGTDPTEGAVGSQEFITPSTSSEHCVVSFSPDGSVATPAIDTRSVVANNYVYAPGSYGAYDYITCEVAADYAKDGTRIPLVVYSGIVESALFSGEYSYAVKIKIGDFEPVLVRYYFSPDFSESGLALQGDLLAMDLRSNTWVMRLLDDDPFISDVPHSYLDGGPTVMLFRNGRGKAFTTFVSWEEMNTPVHATSMPWDSSWWAFAGACIGMRRSGLSPYGNRAGGLVAGTLVSPMHRVNGVEAYFQGSLGPSSVGNDAVFCASTGLSSPWTNNHPQERRGVYRFPSYDPTTPGGMFTIQMSLYTNEDFPAGAVDANGFPMHTSMTCGDDGEVIASCAVGYLYPQYNKGAFPTWYAYGGGLLHGFANFILDAKENVGSLPAITGIDATKARFSPVWQLGKLPDL